MTADQIAAIYREVESFPRVVPDPQLGFTYFSDQIMSARRVQDRIGDFIIAVNRDTARVRVQLRSLRGIARLSGTSTEERYRDQMQELENEADELKFLAESLATKATNMRNAVFDLRAVMEVLETRLKLGEVAPPPKEKEAISGPDTSESAMMVERFLNSETRGAPSHH